ncbi:MAG: gamma-glutamyltransferase [bacterium]|nr:gamma-glutamyltransferase [bacterium]
MLRSKSIVAGLMLFTAVIAETSSADDPRSWVAHGRRGMVASDSPEASQAGLEILRAGGNAVDAAAAVSFALAVARPQSTGLGGGGFMLIRKAADGQVSALDYREAAPQASTPEMFCAPPPSAAGRAPAMSYGYLAVAVPGVLAGQAEAVDSFGTMPLKRLLQPAIRLAEQGFAADQHYARAARTALQAYQKYPELVTSCAYVHRVHLGGGQPPQVGARVVQPELARLLRAIANEGPSVFYRGPVAEAIERTMRARGGCMTRADLAEYRALRRTPLRARYRGYDLIVMPPPSSGGTCVVETLNILETFDLPALWANNRPLGTHYLVEAMRHAFADRARWMGDPDFSALPVQRLTDKAYGRELAARIRPDHTVALEACGVAAPRADHGTSHICVVDQWGNAVVATETINTSFGSFAAVDEWGLILNDEMDDFATQPGTPNVYDLIQSERNAPQPLKRPLSSMSPTIVLEDGQVLLLVGGSGGPRIISAVLNVLVGVLDGGRPLPEAVAARRVHHQWKPDHVYFDSAPPAELKSYLESLGHSVSDRPRGAAVQAIQVTSDGLIGVADPRKGGRPAGY